MLRDVKIDLHMHSTHSDGTCSTRELLTMFHELGIEIAAFTDHDSVGCYHDLNTDPTLPTDGVDIIQGVEMEFQYDGQQRDMLGYGIDVDLVQKKLDEIYSLEHRIEKQSVILAQFKEKCRAQGLKFNEDLRITDGRKAEAFTSMYYSLNEYPENLEKYPVISNNTEFFWKYFSNKESPLYVNETFDLPTMQEIVDILRGAGATVFLAHPNAYGMAPEVQEKFVADAVKCGIDGIEASHNTNKPGGEERIRRYAAQYDLLISGGSDFHGALKPGLNLLTGYGNVHVRYDDIEPWIGKVCHWQKKK